MSKKFQKFTVPVDIYRTEVEVIVSAKEHWVAGAKSFGFPENLLSYIQEDAADSPGTAAFYIAAGSHILVLLQPNFTINELVHEVTHVTLLLLKELKLDDKNTEAEAYLAGYLCDEIYKRAKKKPSKKKPR